MKIDLLPPYLEILRAILRKHLSSSAKVGLFGSRAKGTAKKFSDIDLVIDAGSKLSLAVLVSLNNDFEESDLPYKVDVVDWWGISQDFQERIKQEQIVLPF